MITKTKELKLYGYLMIFLGLLDIVYLLMDIQEIKTLLEGYSTAVIIVVSVILAVCGLITLAKFWMGRQALCYAKGTGKGTSHIKLAKIGVIFSILILVFDAIAIFSGTASYFDAISTIVDLIVIHSYYTTAKACL